jgi:hypothetical protein
MTPRPDIEDGVPVCSLRCPHWKGAMCQIDRRWTHTCAPRSHCLPVIRWAYQVATARPEPMTEEEAARVAAEDDSTREMRRRMGR